MKSGLVSDKFTHITHNVIKKVMKTLKLHLQIVLDFWPMYGGFVDTGCHRLNDSSCQITHGFYQVSISCLYPWLVRFHFLYWSTSASSCRCWHDSSSSLVKIVFVSMLVTRPSLSKYPNMHWNHEKSKVFQISISSQCSLFIPPGKIRKSKVFRSFQGV